MSAVGERVEESLTRVINPLVFISHDTRDADLAEAFSNLLKSVSAGVLKSFRTSDRRGNQGIEYGVEWYPEIIKNIQGASDVVCLLTKRSVNRPWILFEAGMAKGKLDTPILGVALGIELKDASTGPFAQFQNCGDDEDSLTKLVFQLVDRIPNSEPDRDTIRFQVGKFKKSIEPILFGLGAGDLPNGAESASKQVSDVENSSAKLFEEIKIMFQDLPSRIEKSSVMENKRRRRKMHPAIIEEAMHFVGDSKIGFRIALSLYKDKFPWIYDEGVNLLSKLDSLKSPISRGKAIESFEGLLFGSLRNPVVEKFIIEDSDDYSLLTDMPRVLMRALERMMIENSET
ncbi:MAG: toll/interleukin-1 receptor domain-containing protein [Lysobacter sp.]|nr:toll/interleukin-1 receptor domain-containing protein [Lysobacter sp.]